jgi:cutinase
VASQGVNYLGLIETNFYPGGGPPYGIYEMQVLLANAAIYCPQSKIIAAGYSQGAAITHRAIENLPQYVRDRIAGVVTFGDTQALQDGGRIKGYPIEKTMIICNPGDMVCWGSIYIAPTHFPAYYVARVPEAVAFLVARVAATP